MVDISHEFHELVVDEIVKKHIALDSFWRNSAGWAPSEAADLLEKSRLDRQVALSKCLSLWKGNFDEEVRDGMLILAWANLGSLVEGTLKLFLAVWYNTYEEDDDSPKRQGKLISPDKLTLEQLRQFFVKKGFLSSAFTEFVATVQARRNAIHSFKDREIGNENDFFEALCKYRDLIEDIDLSLPYPDSPPYETF